VECELKVRRMAIGERCSFIRGDVFEYEFAPRAYDCALVGFLLSHVAEEQEHLVMQALRETLRPGAPFLILESAWTELRAGFNEKTERQARRLNDGTEFKIYKRYISREDIGAWERNYGLRTTIEHFGEALCAVSAAFTEVLA
jgi:ubiquinone/menaquinone biosynthesis C-methylase UbiE